MITNKDLIIAFFPAGVPFESCVKIIEEHVQLCSRECHAPPIITSRLIKGIPEKYLLLLNDEEYVSTLTFSEKAIEKALDMGSSRLMAVSCKQHVHRCVRDLQRKAPEFIKIIGSAPDIALGHACFKNFHLKKLGTLPRCLIKEMAKRLLPWPVYSFLASRA